MSFFPSICSSYCKCRLHGNTVNTYISCPPGLFFNVRIRSCDRILSPQCRRLNPLPANVTLVCSTTCITLSMKVLVYVDIKCGYTNKYDIQHIHIMYSTLRAPPLPLFSFVEEDGSLISRWTVKIIDIYVPGQSITIANVEVFIS